MLISLLSEKALSVPELGQGTMVRAVPGFNVIATANLRDRGVHEMSSALKRRFSFETVHPIADPAFERELLLQQVQARLARPGVAAQTPEPVIELLVTVFQELRTGRIQEGWRCRGRKR